MNQVDFEDGSWLPWRPAHMLADGDDGSKLACRAGAEHEECEIVQHGSLCDHRNMTAGLCKYVFKSTIVYSAELFLERTKLFKNKF